MSSMTPTPVKTTPMMAQWYECKQQAKEALLLFRLGDFYEAFEEDAKIISSILSLTLTERGGVPMCGVPWQAAEGYIDRLVAKGFRVAISEQMEDPKQVKGLVKRQIVRTITPGTQITSSLLQAKNLNFFASISKQGPKYGTALIDVTTGKFIAFESNSERELLDELSKLSPKELLVSRPFFEREKSLISSIHLTLPVKIHKEEEWRFDFTSANYALTSHLKVATLDGLGLKEMHAAICAAGALFRHIRDELNITLDHITTLTPYCTTDHLVIDRATRINLEITEPLQTGKEEYTLLATIDVTKTNMGGRLLRTFLAAPLTNVDAICHRQEGVFECKQFIAANSRKAFEFEDILSSIYDIERLIVKVKTGFAGPRDLITLAKSLEKIPLIKETLVPFSSPIIVETLSQLHDVHTIVETITRAIVENPPIRMSDGGLFKSGYSSALDELTSIKTASQEWLCNYQQKLREETGIKTLKVGFTRMFGYYIEVSRGQSVKMPESFMRRQTLVNAERYISPELKEYEEKIFSADEKISLLESELFSQLINSVAAEHKKIIAIAQAVALIDVIFSFARIAYERKFCRPHIVNTKQFFAKGLRHPVIEKHNKDKKFVPNDIHLDGENITLDIITGPNMAGKSTYIRQVALCAIMAQIGSFVAAEEATLGIIDKLFCRIGASDDLTRGQSTFMVEMCETANILHNATDRSLVILDEIGRGTSTYDGIAIAWSVVEYLSKEPEKRAKTLFATHYYELTELETLLPNVKNYTVAVSETPEGIHFLYTIIPGKTDKSWGIHVAQLAGLPEKIIVRAKEILNHLKTEKDIEIPINTISQKQPVEIQQDLFSSSIIQQIEAIDVLNITPLQALQFIMQWKKFI